MRKPVFDVQDPTEKDKEPRYHIFCVDLKDKDWSWRQNDKMTQLQTREDVKLCNNKPTCDHCRLESAAIFVHRPCFQLAQKRLSPFSLQLLGTLAIQTRPITAWRHVMYTGHWRNHLDYLPDLSNMCNSTALASIVASVRKRFPVELERMICNKTTGLFHCLAICSPTLDCFISSGILDKSDFREPTEGFPFSSCSPITRMGINNTSILG